MVSLCMYCGCLLGTAGPEQDGWSHGICEPCFAAWAAWMDGEEARSG